MSAVEVRFENLSVDADVHVGGRALPTVLNSLLNFVEVTLQRLYVGDFRTLSLFCCRSLYLLVLKSSEHDAKARVRVVM